MIRSMHAMFYSSRADELRAFLRDKLGLSGTDISRGWLIFNAPEADLGVNSTEGNEPASGTADISFIATTSRRRCPSRNRAESNSRRTSKITGSGS